MAKPRDARGEAHLPANGDGDEPQQVVERSREIAPAVEVWFDDRDISPEDISMVDLAEVIRAVQRLIIGQRPDDAPRLSSEDKLRLVEIRKGSALYALASPRIGNTEANLRIVGNVIEQPNRIGDNDYILHPIDQLSRASAKFRSPIVIREPSPDGSIFARIEPDTYDRISKSALISGQTEYCGRVIRVGNATRSKCGLRVDFQKRLLICNVPNISVARKIGENLYKRVIVSGEATWTKSTWRVFSFRVDEVRALKQNSLIEKIDIIRKAGGSDWDEVTDIRALLDDNQAQRSLGDQIELDRPLTEMGRGSDPSISEGKE